MALLFNVDGKDPASYPGSGSTWYDTSGNARNITLFNSPPFDSGTSKSFTFDGSTQYGTFSDAGLPAGTSARTLAAWIRNYSFNTSWGTFSYGTDANSQSSGLFIYSDSFRGLADNNDFIVAASPSLGRWYHLAMTFVGTDVKLYVNGFLAGSGTKTWNTVLNFGSIGRYVSNSSYANVSLGRISIYDTVLTDGEVLSLYSEDTARFAEVVPQVQLIETPAYETPAFVGSLSTISVIGGAPTPNPVVPSHAGKPSVI